MIVISLIKHNFRRQLRDRLGLGLTLLTAPFLVLLYGILFNQNQVAPQQVVVYGCEGIPSEAQGFFPGGVSFIDRLQQEFPADGTSPVLIRVADSPTDLKEILQSGKAVIGVECRFMSQRLQAGAENSPGIILHGIPNHPFFKAASTSIQLMVYRSLADGMGIPIPLLIEEQPVGPASQLTTFDRYVPALLVFATIMLVFSAAMSVTREVENGTLERLRMTRLNTLELMMGLSVVQLTLGILAVGLTFITSWTLGFNPAGHLGTAFLLTTISCFSSVGLGMIVASLSRTLVLSFLIASVSMFLMVLFSGIVLPRPEVALFQLFGQSIDLFDILPTTHLGVGLEKVLILGAPVTEITYEASALAILSIVYFGIGVTVFRKTSYSFFNR